MGSGGDARRGDGATLAESFPFACELSSSVAAPNQVRTEANSLTIDTRSWFGNNE